MRLHEDLGDLETLQIWHDNTDGKTEVKPVYKVLRTDQTKVLVFNTTEAGRINLISTFL
jgi:hypothetical protein